MKRKRRPRKAKVDESGLATSVLMALHRLIKQSTLYEEENDAQRRQIEMTRKAVAEFGRRVGRNPKMYFTENSVFIGSKLLRAGRAIYIAALELGETLKRFDINEVAIGFDVSNEELTKLQGYFRMALRNQGANPKRFRYKRVRLRSAAPPHLRTAERNRGLAASELVVRNYCTAIVVMRRFLTGLQKGNTTLPPAVRRIAEQLADLSAVQSPVFLASTALYNSRHEHAGRAVNSALIAVAMAKQLGDDPRTLVRAALAALLYDVGIPKVAGSGPTGEGRVGAVMPTVGVDQEAELPAASGMVASELTGLGNAGMVVTSLVYEALHINHKANAGAAYGGGQGVSLEAYVVATARRFTDLIADPEEERTADQAVSILQAEATHSTAGAMLQLLTCALGMFSTGNLLELSDGHVAQVIHAHDNPQLFGWPIVRLVLDPHGGPIQDGLVVDLAELRARGEASPIVRLVAMGENQDVSDGRSAPRSSRAGYGQDSNPVGDSDVFGADATSWPGTPAGAAAARSNQNTPQGVPDWGGAVPRRQFSSYVSGEGPISVDFKPASQPQPPGDATNHAGTDEEANMYGARRAGRASPLMPPASVPMDTRTPTPQQPFAIQTAEAAAPAAPVSAPTNDEPATLIASRESAQALVEKAQNKSNMQSPLMDAMRRAGAMAPVHTSDSSTESALDGAPTVMSSPTNVMDLVNEKMRALGHQGSQVQANEAPARPSTVSGKMPDFDLGENDLDTAFDDILEQEQQQPRSEDGDDQVTRHLTANAVADLVLDATPAAPEQKEQSPASEPTREEAEDATSIFDANKLNPLLDSGMPMTDSSNAEPPATETSDGHATTSPNPTAAAAGTNEPAQDGPGTWYEQIPATLKATAEGKLADTPLLHLLIYALDQSLSGTLLLRHDDEHYALKLEAGLVQQVRTTSLIHPLGRVLADLSLVDAELLREATKTCLANGTLLGAHLREQGAIGDGALRSALKMQLRRKLSVLFELEGETVFRFFTKLDLLENYGGSEEVSLDPLSQVMVVSRSQPLASMVAPLRRFSRTGVMLHQQAPVLRLELNGQEQAVVEAIRSSRITLAELAKRRIASKDTIVQTLYGLLITRCLEVGGESLPVGASDQPPPSSKSRGPASGLGLSTSKSTPSPFRPDRGSSPSQHQPEGQEHPPRIPTTQGIPQAPRQQASTGAVVRRNEPSSREDGLPRRGTSSSAEPPQDFPSKDAEGKAPNSDRQPRQPPPPRGRKRPPTPLVKRRKAPPPPRPKAPGKAPAKATAKQSEDPRRAEIEKKSKSIARENFFQVLGVEQSADTKEVQSAYFNLAKHWHPDRLPEELIDMRPIVAKIFSRVNEAYQTLTDQTKREQYSAALARGGNAGERAAVERAVDSALLFQKGEVLFKKGQLGAAETLVQKAANQDPKQPEYQALLAWIQSERLGLPPNRKEGEKSNHYRAQIGMLDSVLTAEPDFARALFYRAQLLKRSGYADMAMRDFKRCAELDPRNLDAVREVRIHRRRTQREDSAAASIFNRFFNKGGD